MSYRFNPNTHLRPLKMDDLGEFTKNFFGRVFISTSIGNYEGPDPNNNGGEEAFIIPFDGDYKEWIEKSIGRNKGYHKIHEFCGKDTQIIESEEECQVYLNGWEVYGEWLQYQINIEKENTSSSVKKCEKWRKKLQYIDTLCTKKQITKT